MKNAKLAWTVSNWLSAECERNCGKLYCCIPTVMLLQVPPHPCCSCCSQYSLLQRLIALIYTVHRPISIWGRMKQTSRVHAPCLYCIACSFLQPNPERKNRRSSATVSTENKKTTFIFKKNPQIPRNLRLIGQCVVQSRAEACGPHDSYV